MENFQSQMNRGRSSSNSSVGSSPGSPSMSSRDEEDRLVRYNKLLVEYSKAKQKIVVLKQAILKEKERNEQHEKMMRDKDVLIRSSMEKIDFIEFANTKLSKTVTALQDEIQELQKSAGGSWFGGGKRQLQQKEEELKILRVELEAKIQENAVLHTRLSDQRKESTDQSELLNAKLTSMKNLLSIKTEEAEEARASLGSEKQQFFDQNQHLREIITQMENALESNRLDMIQKEKKMKEENERLKKEVEESVIRIKNKLTFDDSEEILFNVLNLSDLQLKEKKRNLDLGNRFVLAFGELKDGFKEFHEISLERSTKLESSSESLKTVNRKISEILPEHHKIFSLLTDKIERLTRLWKDEKNLEEISKEILTVFEKLLNCRKNLLGIELLRLEEESKLKGVSASLQTRNGLLAESHYQVFHHFESLVSSPLQSICSNDGQPFSIGEFSQLLEESLLHLDNLEKSYRTHVNQYNSKSNDEQVSNSQSRILGALSEIIGCIRIAFETAEELPHHPVRGFSFKQEDSKLFKENNFKLSLHKMRNRNSQYLSILNQVEEPSRISFEESKKNAQKLIEAAEKVKKSEEIVKTVEEKLENLSKEKSGMEVELVSFRDEIASRQTQTNSLLSELASTRSKLEKINQVHSSALQEKESAEKNLRESLETKEKSMKALEEQLKNFQEQRLKAEEKEKLRIQQEKEKNHQEKEKEEEKEKERIQQEREKIQLEREKVAALLKEKQELEMSLATANANASAATAALAASNAQKGEEETVVIPEPQIIYVTKEAEKVIIDTLEQFVQTEEEESPEKTETETQTDFVEPTPVVIQQNAVVSKEKEVVTTQPEVESTPKDYSLIVMDANGNQFDSLNVSESDKEREKAIKEFYDFKLEKVSAQMALLDARSVQLFHAYKQSLSKLQKVVEEKKKMETGLKETEGKLTIAKEDLDLTRKNYEQQMTVFTEHITGQSETISTQETEIFALKNMLKSKK